MSRGEPAVGVLGRLCVGLDENVLGPSDLGGRKPKQVLEILLVHQGQPVPKDRLAYLLWGDDLPRDPMRTLEAYVSVLRARLASIGAEAGLVRTEPGAYGFDVSRTRLDLREFDGLVEQARAVPPAQRRGLRERALALVRGELLADEPFAEWALPLRDLYAERHLLLLLDVAEDALAEGLADEAADYAERVLAAQPTRERAYRLLMAAQYAAGDQDRALQTYQRCRRVLEEELGVRPLPETEGVFRAVLAQQPAPEPTRRPGMSAPRPPQVRFARNGDATIAYQVVGSDGPALLFAHAWFSHMEVGWEDPHYRRFLHRLAHGRRLVLFDRRGMGMSDPAPASVTLEERADDMRAVLDAAGVDRAILIGSCGSGPAVLCLAARAPERVVGLVLIGTYPRMLAAEDYPCGWSPSFFAAYRSGLEQAWSTGRGIQRSAPSAGGDEALMEWLGRLLRLSVSPAGARAILEFGATVDVRPLLPTISAPALVLHRRDDQWVHPDNGRYLAEHLPDARFMLLDGADHWPWFGDADAVLDAIGGFLADLAGVPS